MKRKALIPFVLLLALGLFAAVYPEAKNDGPTKATIVTGDVAWMLTATGLVLLMTPGLSFFYGGMVRPKNILSTMMQSFVAMGIVSLVWVVIGFSLAFGESINGIVGNPLTYFMFRNVDGGTHPQLSPTIPLALFALFQLKFAIITPALITGSFAERVRFSAYLIFIVLFTILIYAPLAHWTWHPDGFLHKWGVLDFAGGSVVHMSAGFAALAGAWLLGKRHLEEENKHQNEVQHLPNLPFVILGTGMLWFGWFGFNAGSALAANETAVLAFLTTNTASASAMLSWMFFDWVQGRKPGTLGACIGAVVGLVAITPAAGYVSVGASIFIGIAAAIVSNLTVHWKNKTNLDDTLDVFPCHGMGGIVGMILTAVFARQQGLIFGNTGLFVQHILALFIVAAFTFGGSVLIYKITSWMIPLRVTRAQEIAGLDISQHAETTIG